MILKKIKSHLFNQNNPLIKRATPLLQNFYCPIKFNFKDTLHKYPSSSYSILNKMEDNFEVLGAKLKNIGKLNKNL